MAEAPVKQKASEQVLARFHAMQSEISDLRDELRSRCATPSIAQTSASSPLSQILARFTAAENSKGNHVNHLLASPLQVDKDQSLEHNTAMTLLSKVHRVLVENHELRLQCEQQQLQCKAWEARVVELENATKPTNGNVHLDSCGFSESSAYKEFAQRLHEGGFDVTPKPRQSKLRGLFNQVQMGEVRLSSKDGCLSFQQSVVRAYLIANVAGEERFLLEHDRFDIATREQQTRMLPLDVSVRQGETWRDALRRGLEIEVGLRPEFQDEFLDEVEDSYFCFDDEHSLLQESEAFAEVPVSAQVHEIHIRVRPSPKMGILTNEHTRTLDQIGLPAGRNFVHMEHIEDGAPQSILHVWSWASREYEKNGKLKAFAKFLEAHGVDVDQFGMGTNKTLLSFYSEVKEKRVCQLRVVPPDSIDEVATCAGIERVVEVLKIRLIAEVHNRMRVLTQVEEYMEDGRKRKVNQMLVKKMREGEDWEAAAWKVIEAKLNLPQDVQLLTLTINHDKMTYEEERRASQGYAGISTLYKVRTISIYVNDTDDPDLDCIGLPRGNDFVSCEEKDSGDDEIRVWTWALAEDEQTKHQFTGTGLEELNRDLQDVEQMLAQAGGHPQAASFGLDNAMRQAVEKIKRCVHRLCDIDKTVGEVDINAVMGNDRRESSSGNGSNNLKNFLMQTFTRTGEKSAAQEQDSLQGTANSKEKRRHTFENLFSGSPLLQSINAQLTDWGYDFFTLDKESGSKTLQTYGEVVLIPICVNALHCGEDLAKPRVFLKEMVSNYYDNPYHCALHATQVCHLGNWLQTALGIVAKQSELERAAFTIAAFSHDIRHIGRNNAFCINTEHWLALRYNNMKVLENLHSATCFELLQETQMLSCLSTKERSSLREQIIEFILATDMAEHFETISKLRVRCDSSDISLDNEADRRYLARMCLKAGDIGHSALPWEIHKQWSTRVSQEFFSQGDEERSLGLPISALCDRSTVSDIAKSQKGFLDFVCMPLFQVLSDYQTIATSDNMPVEKTAEAASGGCRLTCSNSDRQPQSRAGSRIQTDDGGEPAVRSTRKFSRGGRRKSTSQVLLHHIKTSAIDAIERNKKFWQTDDESVEAVKALLMQEPDAARTIRITNPAIPE